MRGPALAAALILGGTALAQSDRLAGSEWRPVEIDGLAVSGEIESFVQFRAEGQVAGHAGCNRFTGSYRVEGDRLEFGPLATTRRACPPPVMDHEARILDALARVRGFSRDRIDLVLTDADGAVVLNLAQTDAD